MIHEMQIPVDITILMLPVVAHFALLIGFSVWGFIDDSHNRYAKWFEEKISKLSCRDWDAEETFFFTTKSFCVALFYIFSIVLISNIHVLAPYALAGFVAMMLIGRSLRRLQKVVTEHINDKKIHKGGK